MVKISRFVKKDLKIHNFLLFLLTLKPHFKQFFIF